MHANVRVCVRMCVIACEVQSECEHTRAIYVCNLSRVTMMNVNQDSASHQYSISGSFSRKKNIRNEVELIFPRMFGLNLSKKFE